ncbi:MAG: glycerol-3-phosphate 1-O-acyltransferase PlsY [Bacteroidales bacterium]|nr:glycerol-3-phosphate 1-O-acyltransferase PlsY [Bacteroidales bacterium]MDD4217431.1 glycerol-3-phosphate 1-O-acyltransferase PlsY [Bacteroidales bacterium]
MLVYLIIFSIISYLIGSFSSAVWYGKWFYKTDVREYGSKNAGATNTLRVLGVKAALPVFITDILKSYLAVQLIWFVPDIMTGSEQFYQIKLLFGVSAVIGHIFPLYTNFKGGKGVASMLGLVLALHPAAAGLSLAVFSLVFIFTRIVSISSISAALVFPVIIYLLEKAEIITLSIFSVIAAILIVITHLKNIKRLLKGEEKKMHFKKKQ